MFRQIIVTLLTKLLLPLRLRHLTIPLSAGALLIASALAAANEPVTAPATLSRQGGVLFKIQRSGHSAYVFGTIHVGRADFYPLDDKVQQALNHASCIALEIDPGNTRALAPLMTKYGIYPDGKSHIQDLAPPLQKNLNVLLEKYHLTPASVANMKPWLIAILLGISEYTSQGYLPQYGIDTALANVAKSANKQLVELETAEDQLSLLGNLSSAEQVLFLQDSINELQGPAKVQRSLQLIALWRSGDLDGLAAMLAEMTSDDTFTSKFVRRALLDGRNPGLADGIDKLATSTPNAFVGIGMLHLVGTNSVLSLLRRRGYTIKQIY